MKNYYDILGLPSYEDNQDAILLSYQNGTQKLGELVFNGNDGEQSLIDLNEAFLVLSDKSLKVQYDYCLSQNSETPELAQSINALRDKATDFIKNRLADQPKKAKKSVWPAILCGLLLLSAIGTLVRECSQALEASTSNKVFEDANQAAGRNTDYGIDVSGHNGRINWKKVAEYNPQFVYIKASEGATYKDSRYSRNASQARNNGLFVGSYHYFRMTSSAHAQFANFINAMGDHKQDLIPMIDVETTDSHPVQEVRDSLNVFIGLVKKHFGVRPMIYGTNRSYNTICGANYKSYPAYIGRYGKNEPVIKGQATYTIWQYSERGHIDGIPKPVDMARFHPGKGIKDILLRK